MGRFCLYDIQLKTRRPPIQTAEGAVGSYGQLRTAVGIYGYINFKIFLGPPFKQLRELWAAMGS